MRKKVKLQDNQLTFKLSTALKNDLYAFADVRKASVGDCMRVAVEMFLADENHYQQMTVTTFMGEEEEL